MPPKRKRNDADINDRPTSKPRTRSDTQEQRDAEQAEYEAELARRAEEVRARREQALADRPKAPPGNRGDGKLHIAFIMVGQGDCTVISTPGGRTLLVDCGSTATDGDNFFKKRVRRTLRGVKFLGGTNTIDVLILTHPDRDHYNRLIQMLGTDFTVQDCYHSARSDQYSDQYTSTWLGNQIVDELHIKQVVHNNDSKHGAPGQVTLNGVAVKAAGGGTTVDRLDGRGGIRIVDEPTCKMSILAAGVTARYHNDGSEENNRGSIVTLIEAFGKKILLCGDATINTEQYLINTAGERLKDLTVAQIGHHGSKLTSSSRAFVRLVNPQVAVASAGKKVDTYHLPNDTVLIRYQNQLSVSARTKIKEHETFWWVGDEEHGGYTAESGWSKYEVFTTGSRSTIELTFGAAQ